MSKQQREYPSFKAVANNLSLLEYNPSKARKDEPCLIGEIEAGDGSVARWSIVPLDGKYAICIEMVMEGYDENFEYIPAKDPRPVYLLPVNDENEQLEESSPSLFETQEDAFDAFLEVVYTTEATEAAFIVREEAKKIIKGYAQPETMSFEEFKQAIANASMWDERNGRYEMSRLANAMISVRYPFMNSVRAADEGYDEQDADDNFGYTQFDAIPSGWAYRFGLELCEDIRNQCWDADPRIWEYRLCESRVDQIKEKFGELRFYGSFWGKSHDIIEAYTALSRSTCIKCGKTGGVRTTTGWILPYCWEDVIGNDADAYELRNKICDEYLPDDASWEDRSEAFWYAKLKYAFDTTFPAACSDELEKMTREWEWESYSEEGRKSVNKAIGLLDGTLAPNGEPIWARKAILDAASDARVFDEWMKKGFIDEEGISPGRIVSEYGAPDLVWDRAEKDEQEDTFGQ